MPKNGGSSRNQRNDPYQLDKLFVKFNHTPAGIAWRWRTELLTLAGPGCRTAVAGHLGHPHLGRESSSAAWPS